MTAGSLPADAGGEGPCWLGRGPMFCPTCGAASQLGVSCQQCKGSLVGDGVPAMYGVMPKTSGLAIAGFVLAFFCGLLGLIFSAMALSEIKKSNGTVTGEGFA